MDFGTLLHVAKKNSESTKNEGSKYYSTKFAPPKKVSKEKKLSENIQKFLQKREQEEQERKRAEKEKVSQLLAMRDEKSKNKIKKMLKVTKSANKSVLDDVNMDQTAVTLQGADQPDQDDYGYVSTEANAFYQKYIDKVKDVHEDKGFAPSRPQSLKDLSGTKERVKAAITREIDEKKSHTRLKSSSTTSSTQSPHTEKVRVSRLGPVYDPDAERREEERKKREEEQKRVKNRKPVGPPLDFQALLKLAEKKQHEPVEIVQEVKKKKDSDRLLTSKERMELEERLRERKARERRREEANRKGSAPAAAAVPSNRMEPNGRIPKLNQGPKPTSSSSVPPKYSISSKPLSSSSSSAKPSSSLAANSKNISSNKTNSVPSSSKPSTSAAASSSKSTLANNTSSSGATKNPYGAKSKAAFDGPAREFPPREMKSIKPRQFPPPDVQKARQFPPADVRRGGPGQQLSQRDRDNRKSAAAAVQKRRIYDDDDSEYDSELDDFIDDGDEEEDYSSHIKAIFGYDKSRYRDIDEEDDAAMESNFAQQQREEYISKKIGIKEDLDDMRQEAIDKKRKMLAKKRRLHD